MAVDILRDKILGLVEEYANTAHTPKAFVPGQSPVRVSGRVYGAEELRFLVDASLDFWLTTGRFNARFEAGLRQFLGVKHVLTTNSGSSANLLAVSALTSPTLGDRRLQPGDEVITAAAAFPTTVNPLLQHGLIPVFIDVDIPTYNVRASIIEEAITERTRAIMLAHTLGNPFDLDTVTEICDKYGLWLIEDCCDALGSTYTPSRPERRSHASNKGAQMVGTFGDIASVSFYPAHHITMGEGGAVWTNHGNLKLLLASFRDWGRDCFCDPGMSNTCGKRFDWELGELPRGYDHKYIYSHAGYNLKITDMQAAVGLAQLSSLREFIDTRKRNFSYLYGILREYEELLILPEPTPKSDPAWFGFPITLREDASVGRAELVRYLDECKVETRQVFGGNLTKQPYFQGRRYRIVGGLENSDRIMNRSFWLGIYPGLTEEMLDYVAEQLKHFFAGNRRCR